MRTASSASLSKKLFRATEMYATSVPGASSVTLWNSFMLVQ